MMLHALLFVTPLLFVGGAKMRVTNSHVHMRGANSHTDKARPQFVGGEPEEQMHRHVPPPFGKVCHEFSHSLSLTHTHTTQVCISATIPKLDVYFNTNMYHMMM